MLLDKAEARGVFEASEIARDRMELEVWFAEEGA